MNGLVRRENSETSMNGSLIGNDQEVSPTSDPKAGHSGYGGGINLKEAIESFTKEFITLNGNIL